LAANKAYHLFQQSQTRTETVTSTSAEPLEDFFFANVEYSLVRITIPQITHIEGLKDYVKIFIEGEKRPILTKMTMKALEVKVDPHGFMRVHKSFIVNLRKIESIKQLRIKIGTYDIPVSDTHAAELLEKLNYSRPS
jgi:DNA-binding LytR/AlgR family response regulator